MNGRYFLLLILLIPSVALAQGPPYRSQPLGGFEVDEMRGCAPFTVTIVRSDLALPLTCVSQPCDMNWGDGSGTQPSQFTHTYTQPGTYTLSIVYQGPFQETIQITVYPNVQPAFNVYICSANEVQVHVTDTNYDSYIINYNDASPEVEVPKGSLPVNHSFGSSGTKNISVRGKNANAADNCTPPANKTVVVAAGSPIIPTIDQLITTSSSVIDLEMTTQQNVLYRLEMSVNGGTFGNLGNLLNVNTTSVPGLNTDENFYCFRLGVVNPCLGSVTYSAAICSADLAVSAVNNANNLTWATLTTGITNFTIEKDPDPATAPPPTAATTALDGHVECGTEYCYRVVSNYANGSRSFSARRCVTAISTDIPTAIANVTSIVNGASVELEWLPDAVFQAETYAIFRQSNGASFNLLQSGIVPTAFTDNNYTTTGQYCYRIDYTDVCGNTSDPGITACPVILRYSTTSDNSIILTWTAYTGWTAGVNHYEVDKYNLEHTLLQTFPAGVATTLTDSDLTDQGYYYVVRAIPNDNNNDESVSNEVNAIRALRFAYPKAFTPDAQGPVENETFKVFVTEEFIVSFEMRIFNRWGEIIFYTTDLIKGWNGEFNGQPQPEGTYTFTATLKDKTGKIYKRDGSVVLLRKK